MSDAWNTPGWTAQQSAYYYTDDGVPGAWKLPDDVETVRLRGQFGDIDGGRPRGYVRIVANADLMHTPTKTLVSAPDFVIALRIDGTIDASVPATDATTLVSSAPPFQYTVSVVLGRKMFKQFTTTLPLASPEVNLSDLIAASAA